jgi:hypothetical protein
VRAWNSYIDVLNLPYYPPMGQHILETLFAPPPETAGAVAGSGGRPRAERQARWLREFWFQTANLCGSEPYLRVLSRLAANPSFDAQWLNLALQPWRDESFVIGGPFFFDFEALGLFRASTSVVTVPPNYYLREFVPISDLARQRWEDARLAGPPKICLLDRIHWADA